jgi:hypothetical protein
VLEAKAAVLTSAKKAAAGSGANCCFAYSTGYNIGIKQDD